MSFAGDFIKLHRQRWGRQTDREMETQRDINIQIIKSLNIWVITSRQTLLLKAETRNALKNFNVALILIFWHILDIKSNDVIIVKKIFMCQKSRYVI